MLLNSRAMRFRRLLAAWLAAASLLGCATGAAEPNPNDDPPGEDTPSEGTDQAPDEPTEVTLGGDNSPQATETNVMGVHCEDHEICGEGSACVVVAGQDAGERFSRCSFVLLADSTPCAADADCDGDLRCLQLLDGLDAGVDRICDALPKTGPQQAL